MEACATPLPVESLHVNFTHEFKTFNEVDNLEQHRILNSKAADLLLVASNDRNSYCELKPMVEVKCF